MVARVGSGLKFESISLNGTGKTATCISPMHQRFYLYSDKGPGPFRSDYYLTPNGGVELWMHQELGGENWKREFLGNISVPADQAHKIIHLVGEHLNHITQHFEAERARAEVNA